MHKIGYLGKGLIGIYLFLNGWQLDRLSSSNSGLLNFLCKGCPKLKNLTLEFFPGFAQFEIENLEVLSKASKELEDLKITNVYFPELTTESEVKEIFPNCKVELKKCGDAFLNEEAFDGFFWSQSDLKSLDNLIGGELELMFTKNYGEDIEYENGN